MRIHRHTSARQTPDLDRRGVLARMALAPLAFHGTVRAHTAQGPDAPAWAALDAAVEAGAEEGRLAGAVLLVARHGQTLYERAFGWRAVLPRTVAMTTDTVFDLASLTKVVATAPAVLQLIDQGLLALDDPLARHLDGYGQAGKEAITVRHLLTHTSGLPPGIALGAGESADSVWRRLQDLRPRRIPGGDPVYSDLNFVLLGELVHRLGGRTLDKHCRERLFAPLGMTETGFHLDARWRTRLAPTVEPEGTPGFGQVHDPLAAALGGVAGNAGLFGTAADLARFATAVIHGAPGVLPSGVQAAFFGHHAGPASAPRSLGWRLEAPLVSPRLAWPRMGTASHLGYTGTGLWIDHVTGLQVVLLSSRLHPTGHGDAGPLRRRVLQAVANTFSALDRAQNRG